MAAYASAAPAYGPTYVPNQGVYSPTAGQKAYTAVDNVVSGTNQYLDQAGNQIAHAAKQTAAGQRSGLWNFGVMFLVFAIIIMLVVWLFRLPVGLVTGPGGIVTNQASFPKILATGVIGSLIIIAIIWLSSKIFGSK